MVHVYSGVNGNLKSNSTGVIVNAVTSSLLEGILKEQSNVFNKGLGKLKGVEAQTNVDPTFA